MKNKGSEKRNVTKAVNYTLIAILSGSILYMAFKLSKTAIFVYDLSDKNEIGLYLVWCVLLSLMLYNNL